MQAETTETETTKTKTLRIPVSTYRLQFNRLLPFSQALRIIPYLHELGITDIYSSPHFKSAPGSLHGYDIVRYDQLNPEVGTLEEYGLFTDELSRHGMGQVQDIVPNHMCILGDNPWWQSVLENGQSSLYASFFDIDWSAPLETLRDKVLLPILGDQYGKTLEIGEIQLSFRQGGFFLTCCGNLLPIKPRSYEIILRYGLEELEKDIRGGEHYEELMSVLTAAGRMPEIPERDLEKKRERDLEKEIVKRRLWSLYESSPGVRAFIDGNVKTFNGVKGDPRSFDLLDGLISKQAYRLSSWVVATDEINYRRFFDINQLAAIRPELPDVFDESHRLIFKFIKQGRITGLRVDHLDGLYNPAEYLRNLQEESVRASLPEEEAQGGKADLKAGLNQKPPLVPFYIVGEKILLKGERVPEDWPICGTTGYDFMNSLNGVFIRPESARQMDEIYSRFIGGKLNFAAMAYHSKKLVVASSMSGEINVLGHRLYMLAQKSRYTRDFTLLSLTRALEEVMACFPVYRTYISASGVGERDRRYIEQAVKKAQRMNTSISAQTFEFIKRVLVLEYGLELSADDKGEWLDFVMKFQQQTGPIMAKGLEDTAFYTFNRLLSLNEVGGSPDRFGAPLEAFHGQNIERNKYWPFAMTATSTHDSKRSEDVRARLNVLTEMPRAWHKALLKWKRINKGKKPVLDKPVPGPNEEYHLYQVLLGVWPREGFFLNDQERESFTERIKQYMLKAAREAKVNTSWINPEKDYEEALLSFIERILRPMKKNKTPFLREFAPFANMVSNYGLLNSLSQALLKIASPGVPDFYQGTELWVFSLVDPDNRREVDYEARLRLLNELKSMEASMDRHLLCAELLKRLDDPRTKLYVTWKALQFRKKFKEVFVGGDYTPLEPEGLKKEHLCVFLRKSGLKTALACAPRFFAGLVPPGSVPAGETIWNGTHITLPAPGRFKDVFTDRVVETSEEGGRFFIPVGELLSGFPLFLAEELVPYE